MSFAPHTFLDKIIEQKTDAFFVMDREGLLRYASGVVEKIFGFSPDQVTGKNAREFVAPVDWDNIVASFKQMLQHPGNRLSQDVRILDTHGQYLWMECIFNNMLNIPPIEGVLVQMRDISRRKQAELALQESEERFRIFMDNAPGSAWIRNNRGEYVFVNEMFRKYMTSQGIDLMGKHFSDTFPVHTKEIEETDRVCLEQGKPVDYLFHARDLLGADSDWIIHKFPLVGNSGETLIGAFAIELARFRNDEWLQSHTDSKFIRIFNALPDAVFLEDENGVVLDVNNRACELQGISRGKLIGMNIINLAPDGKKEEVSRFFKKLWEGEIDNLRSWVWPASGTEIPVHIHVSRIEHEGKPAMILTLREIVHQPAVLS
ncbi:MAG: PAS domain S-box protein [Bacteroidia bacterium]|nr:PAS domain S-box protein [Bacteroidia bacterium]